MLSIHDKFPWIKKFAEQRQREKFLAMDARETVDYAIKSGKRIPEWRWIEIEPHVRSDKKAKLKYAMHFGIEDWLLEEYSPEEAYAYIVKTNKRNKKFEGLLSQNAEYAYNYALNYLGKRFPKGEAVIKENPLYAYYYACNIIQGKWREGEPAIKKQPALWHEYNRSICDIRAHRRKSRPKNKKRRKSLS